MKKNDKKFLFKKIAVILLLAILSISGVIVKTAYLAKVTSGKTELALMQASENPNLVTYETTMKIYNIAVNICTVILVALCIAIITEVISVVIYFYRRQI
jgi:hypothetical protein